MRFNEHLSKISGVVKPVVCVSTITGFNSVSVMNNSPRRVGLVIFLIAYKNDELAERNLVESEPCFYPDTYYWAPFSRPVA